MESTTSATKGPVRDESLTIPGLIHPRDVFLLAYLPVWTAISWSVPERYWRALCRAWARLLLRIRHRRTTRQLENIRCVIGSYRLESSPRRILTELIANQQEVRLQGMRHHRPGGWRPRMEIVGREHLECARATGKGVILWAMPLVFNDLVTVAALHRDGFRVVHLQLPGHGFSDSLFGIHFLNPIWNSVNDPFRDRLFLSPARRAQIFPELVRRVGRNELLKIDFYHSGRRRLPVSLLNGSFPVATGGPALAIRTGAALLPVFTVRLEDGTFTTTIEAPLRAPPDCTGEDAVRQLVGEYARLLESRVLRWPDQYQGWEVAAEGCT